MVLQIVVEYRPGSLKDQSFFETWPSADDRSRHQCLQQVGNCFVLLRGYPSWYVEVCCSIRGIVGCEHKPLRRKSTATCKVGYTVAEIER